MYEIPIDDINYHVSELTEAELSWGEATCKNILKRYPALNVFISATLSPLNLDNRGKSLLLRDVALAYCHEIKLSNAPDSREQMEKTVKSWLYSFLPFIVENLKVRRYSHHVQYEPITMACHYLAELSLNLFVSQYDDPSLTEFERYFIAECISLSRSLRSSLALLSIGDDVHGTSLYRGVMELSSKLALAGQFQDEYVLFKKFNCYLQLKKANGEPLPQEMTDYLSNEPAYKTSPENFLAYGWARNSRRNRILTMREMVRVAMKNDEKCIPLLQIASEFTHEDYVGVGYDYQRIRKSLIDHYYILFRTFLTDGLFDELLPRKEAKRIRHLISLTDPIYAGEIPLTQLK